MKQDASHQLNSMPHRNTMSLTHACELTLLDEAAEVSVLLGEVVRAELGGSLLVAGVGDEDGARATALCADNATHLQEE